MKTYIKPQISTETITVSTSMMVDSITGNTGLIKGGSHSTTEQRAPERNPWSDGYWN